ncbi:MAG TPA: hypothetical protein VL126_12855, partial [Bacteroidota bacterium]|nr:hypothetical protein [Bacteroidota bacterium]
MKRVLTLAFLAATVLSAGPLRAQTGADSTVLGAIDYRAIGGASTLTVNFTAPVHFRFSQNGNRVSIRCAHTRVAHLSGGLDQQFASGGVQSVTVQQVAADSAIVTVLLRAHQSASLSARAAKTMLSLSVHPVAFALPEIGALASPTKEDSSGAAKAAEPARTDKALLVIVASTAIAASSTVIILLLVARLGGRRPWQFSNHLRRERAGLPAASNDEGFAQLEDPGERGSTGPDGTMGANDPAEEGPDEFFDLGKDLRRQREEIALAMRLHAGPLLDATRSRARSACKSGATAAERVKMAKRLGIGRGEIELAMRLKNIEEGHPDG